MDSSLTVLVGVVQAIADGRGIKLDAQQLADIAMKGADIFGALVSDASWKAARAAGEAEAAKVKTEEDAEREQRR